MGRCAIEIPGDFAPRIERTHGDVGRAWLGEAALAHRRVRAPVVALGRPSVRAADAQLHRAGRRDRHGGPSGAEARRGLTALWLPRSTRSGCSTATGQRGLLDSDEGLGAMLLERLEPGALLLEVDEREATSVAARLMTRLRRPVPPEHRFHDIWEWMQGLERLRVAFNGGTGPFPASLVERAEAHLFNPQRGEKAVLHGDLHHYNILSAEREPWLAIDPKGIVGEPEYEASAFLRNNLLDQPEPRRVLSARIDQVAGEAALDRERMIGCGPRRPRALGVVVVRRVGPQRTKPDLAVAAMYADLN